MSIIYQPKGRAQEYSKWAANLYKGCSHGCVYCYAPSATFVDRQKFSEKTYIRPRPNVIAQFKKDAIKFSSIIETPILFSFTSDAYQAIEQKLGVTRQAIEICTRHKLRPQILTKSGVWGIARDLELLVESNAIWAATLTTDSQKESIKWEPFAATPQSRIDGLAIAKENGLETWVSFEPVYDPEAVYRLIQKTYKLVDLYKIGTINYHEIAKSIDWRKFRETVTEMLTDLNKPYYIKKELRNTL